MRRSTSRRRRSSLAALGLPSVGLALAWLAACTTEPAYFLSVELLLSDSLVTPSMPVDIEVRATNYGGAEITLPEACPPALQITDAGGTVVGPPIVACPGDPATRTLAPNESTSFITTWSGQSLYGAQLPYAVYVAQGWVDPVGHNRLHTGTGFLKFDQDTTSAP